MERNERVWDGALVDGRENENVGQCDTATVPAELHARTVRGGGETWTCCWLTSVQ